MIERLEPINPDGVVSPDLDVFPKQTNLSVWNASGDGHHLVHTKTMGFEVGFVVQRTIPLD